MEDLSRTIRHSGDRARAPEIPLSRDVGGSAGGNLALLRAPAAEAQDPEGADCRDPAAVYRRHGARVSYWAARLAGPGFDIDDIVHDVFLVVLRRLPEFRGDAQVSTWLHEITVRVVQTHRRRRRRRAWLWPFAALRTADGGVPDPPDEGMTPLESLERRQATALLYRILDQLDDKYRTAVVLYELEGLPCREIATLTGTSLANTWARVSRGRERLIEAFARWEAREKT
jgi:RNA polymerase sigma-70 factor (ECF subfamily)